MCALFMPCAASSTREARERETPPHSTPTLERDIMPLLVAKGHCVHLSNGPDRKGTVRGSAAQPRRWRHARPS